MNERADPVLAAVVIGRNEEAHLAACLASVLRATAPFAGTEVVFVDSRSTDRSVEIALGFPVRVVELRADAPLSAALGRLVGERTTRSRHVLFADGDTEVSAPWVAAAVEYLERHPGVGGVAGKLREVYYVDGQVVGGNPDCFNHVGDAPVEVDQLGGNAIYRRAALAGVGSFNPYVVSYEECELAERMRRQGSTVVRLPIEVGVHHTGPTGTVRELRRRWRDNLIKGYGQALRLAIGQGTFAAHARRMKRYLQFQALLLAGGVAAVASVLSGRVVFFVGWTVVFATLVAGLVVRGRSVTKALRLLLDWGFWSIPLLVGFFERPRDPAGIVVDAVVEHTRMGREAAREVAC